MSPEADYFLPAYHIDSNFTRAFMDVKGSVQLEAIAIDFDHSFTAVNYVKQLDLPVNFLQTELRDAGAYMLLVNIETSKTITIGRLGQIRFERGLTKKVERHLRKKKQQHWHIDYLTAGADKVTAVPIISTERLECELASDLKRSACQPVKGFGSSGCNCTGHLFYFPVNPLHNSCFIGLIQYYRIRRLQQKL